MYNYFIIYKKNISSIYTPGMSAMFEHTVTGGSRLHLQRSFALLNAAVRSHHTDPCWSHHIAPYDQSNPHTVHHSDPVLARPNLQP